MRYRILFLIIMSVMMGLILINCTSNTSSEPTGDSTANPDSLNQSIERGKYLATKVVICLDCHSERDYKYFAGPIKDGTEGMGGEVFDEKIAGVPGKLYARNITPDPETGIGTWTDDEIFTAITRGISKNGDTLFPLMPYINYNRMAKQDIMDIIAYLRTLKPIKHKVPERKLFVPLHMVYPPSLQASVDKNVKPPISDKIKYGEYLVRSAACFDCHTPMENGKSGQPFSGGYTFHLPTFTVTSANITPDKETGIGAWTEEMFLQKFIQYREKSAYLYDPGKLNSIMPWAFFSQMDDYDLKAIYAYLRTLPPVSKKIEKHPTEVAAR
ncbi:MAG: c-type cytochrome [Chitinophagaceae bacterium]|nr:c-type cytochrome [Chitinophagaceae bacterium]